MGRPFWSTSSPRSTGFCCRPEPRIWIRGWSLPPKKFCTTTPGTPLRARDAVGLPVGERSSRRTSATPPASASKRSCTDAAGAAGPATSSPRLAPPRGCGSAARRRAATRSRDTAAGFAALFGASTTTGSSWTAAPGAADCARQASPARAGSSKADAVQDSSTVPCVLPVRHERPRPNDGLMILLPTPAPLFPAGDAERRRDLARSSPRAPGIWLRWDKQRAAWN